MSSSLSSLSLALPSSPVPVVPLSSDSHPSARSRPRQPFIPTEFLDSPYTNLHRFTYATFVEERSSSNKEYPSEPMSSSVSSSRVFSPRNHGSTSLRSSENGDATSSRVEKMKSAVEKMRFRLESLDCEKQKLIEEFRNDDHSLENLRQLHRVSADELNQTRRTARSFQKNLLGRTEELAKMKSELEHLTSETAKELSLIQSTNDKLKIHDERNQNRRASLDAQLEQDRSEYRSIIVEMENEIESVMEESRELFNRLRNLRVKNEELERKVSIAQSNNPVSEDSSVMQLIDERKSSISTLEAEIHDLESESERLEKEIAVRRQQKAEFQDIFEQACSLRNTKMRELDDVLHESQSAVLDMVSILYELAGATDALPKNESLPTDFTSELESRTLASLSSSHEVWNHVEESGRFLVDLAQQIPDMQKLLVKEPQE